MSFNELITILQELGSVLKYHPKAYEEFSEIQSQSLKECQELVSMTQKEIGDIIGEKLDIIAGIDTCEIKYCKFRAGKFDNTITDRQNSKDASNYLVDDIGWLRRKG